MKNCVILFANYYLFDVVGSEFATGFAEWLTKDINEDVVDYLQTYFGICGFKLRKNDLARLKEIISTI